MNDLSDDAKALFDAARPGHEPTQQDREQVRSRLVLRIGAAAATLGVAQIGAAAPLGAGAALASGAKTLLALKLVVGLAVAGGAGGVAYRSLVADAAPSSMSVRGQGPVGKATASAAARPPALTQQGRGGSKQEASRIGLSAPPATRLPAVDAKPAHERSQAGLEPAGSPKVVSSEPEGHARPADAPPPGTGAFPDEPARSSSLSLEARALSGVQRAVRDGRSSEALALLDQQDRDFPQGELRQERVAARVVALCAAGRTSEARALAASFLARAPRSPLAARMRTICVAE